MKRQIILTLLLLPVLIPAFADKGSVIKKFVIYRQAGKLTNAESAAADILTGEIKKRTRISASLVTAWPREGDVIILKTRDQNLNIPVSFQHLFTLPGRPESFRIALQKEANRLIILIEGYDGRGVLFGVGNLLRRILYSNAVVTIPDDINSAESPDKSIRGHQLGYRHTANSYDGWTVAQYDQYIRELIIFGTNSIEAIPFFDQKASPHFKVPPAEMNAKLSSICNRYDVDFWMWIPAQFDLTDKGKRSKYLDTLKKTLENAVRVDGLFFPGGDPGDNAPDLVIPLLEDISALLRVYHPKASIWLSLQGYSKQEALYVYNYIRRELPSWLGGLITGPGSPPVAETRAALPVKYRLRYYPDLTHNVRCEFPVRWWDPAFNFTLGREAVNPRPYQFGAIYRALQQYIDGFISYSDGAHDDVNKVIWTQLAWSRNKNEREILKEYSNFFFNSSIASQAADGILALEKNWEGPIESNGSIHTTMEAWTGLANANPGLVNNWRWQLCLLRANYDAYTRLRYLNESVLEKRANDILLKWKSSGTDSVIAQAQQILSTPDRNPVGTGLKTKIVSLAASLFKAIALQTSVEKHGASGAERGAILDFLQRPVNNRWWMEDELKRIQALPAEKQGAALEILARWENPSGESYYDDVGNIANSPHVIRGEGWDTDPLMLKGDNQGFDWWENGYSRKRLSWMSNMRWPVALEYQGLDSTAGYMVRITGYGESLLKANGQRLTPTLYGKEIGELKEFPIPRGLIKDGRIVLTWDEINEDHLNWRQHSRVTEVWLIKTDDR